MTTASPVPLGAFDASDAPSLDSLRTCVHCGICLPQCPTYRVLGEEVDSPRGRLYLIRAAAEGRTDLTPTFARHLDLCLGCRACESACPSGVPFGKLLEAARGQLDRRGVRAPETDHHRLGWLLERFPDPRRLAVLVAALRLYQKSGLQAVVRSFGLLALAPRLRRMEALLPALPPSGPALPELTPATGKMRGRAGLVLGCMQRYFFPDLNRDTARLVSAAGYDVVTPREQACCGALHLHAGRLEEFRRIAGRFVRAFDRDLDVIVVNAAGCGSALKEYGHWLHDEKAASFAQKVKDISEVLAPSDLSFRELREAVTYHDACHLAHGQRIRAEPRALLRRIPGLTLVELADSEMCCGSAGVYNLLEPEIAAQLGRLKAERIGKTGARIVVAGNAGCIMQIAQHCQKDGLAVEVTHPVSLLARALDGRASRSARESAKA